MDCREVAPARLAVEVAVAVAEALVGKASREAWTALLVGVMRRGRGAVDRVREREGKEIVG